MSVHSMIEIQACFKLILIAPPIQVNFHPQHYGQSAMFWMSHSKKKIVMSEHCSFVSCESREFKTKSPEH